MWHEQETQTATDPGTLIDFITRQPVRSTPEEREAVQPFLEELVEVLGYSRDQIMSHPQHRVPKSPSDKKGVPVDIAVFRTADKRPEDLFIVVECKKRTVRDGTKQLESYLSLSPAEIGVWTNGAERAYVRKLVKRGRFVFESIPSLPRAGQSVDEIGSYTKNALKAPHNLKATFTLIRNYLAGNAQGTTRDEGLAEQLINVIFCKLYDERFSEPDAMLEFRTSIAESPEKLSDRIQNLFNKVKTRYEDVFEASDKITLKPEELRFIAGQLQGLSLLDAERDVVAEAFETFIGPALKGAQGQFFTPRNVIHLLVNLVDPRPGETIIDPACGSGGFLVESLRHMWKSLEDQATKFGWSAITLEDEKRRTAERAIRGIEKDHFLAKVAKAYLVILGDGHSNLFCEDSLELPEQWESETRNTVKMGTFSVVLANPPFGKDIKVVGEDKLRQFDLAHKWVRDKATGRWSHTNELAKDAAPQILFVERCLQLLKPGGRLGIVLPESFFHAPSYAYVLQMLQQHNITWVVDLPHNTFRPHNNAKCLMIVVEKDRPQGKVIKMAMAEEMGHNHRGQQMERWDIEKQTNVPGSVWDDLPLIEAEVADSNRKRTYTFEVDAALAAKKGIYVPRFFWGAKDEVIRRIAERDQVDLVSFGQLVKDGVVTWFDGHGSPKSEAKARGTYPYIRVKDVLDWGVFHNPTSMIPKDYFDQLRSNTKKDLKVADVLYVGRGSYRIGSVAITSPRDLDVALTREINVFRVVEGNDLCIDGFYLLYMLSSEIVRLQTPNKVLMDTTMPNIADRWRDLRLPIHRDPVKRRLVARQLHDAIEDKWAAEERIADLRRTISNAVDDPGDSDIDEAA